MAPELITFSLFLIDKPTVVFVLVVQIIVVLALYLLYKFFTVFARDFFKKNQKQKVLGDSHSQKNLSYKSNKKDTHAAIAMALYLHFNEMHDEESNVITIQRISKTYSPWSSKIYNMRNFR